MSGQALPPRPVATPSSEAPQSVGRVDVIGFVHERPKLWTGLALLSGLSVLPLIYVAQLPLGVLISGSVFGALVLLPFLQGGRARFWRGLALVAIPAAIHWGAMLLTAFLDKHIEGPPAYLAAAVICGVPGVLAASVCALLTALLAPLQPLKKVVAIVSVAGFFGGLGFVFARAIGGYIIWQLLVFLALYFGPKIELNSLTAPKLTG